MRSADLERAPESRRCPADRGRPAGLNNQLVLSSAYRGEGVVEPTEERIDVLGLYGRTAPNSQARRRIAIRCDVVGDAFLLEEIRHILHELRLLIGTQRRDLRSFDLETNRRIGTNLSTLRQEAAPGTAPLPVLDGPQVRCRAPYQSSKAANGLRPP